MKKITVDLDEFNDDVLSLMALSTDDIFLLDSIYNIANERNSTNILISILKNEKKETKDVVEKIARNYKKKTLITSFDVVITNNKNESETKNDNLIREKLTDSYYEDSYNEELQSYIAYNQYTPDDILSELVLEGVVPALFNNSTPNKAINQFVTARENITWVANNPEILSRLLSERAYKLDDYTLEYLHSFPFDDGIENVNRKAELTINVRKSYKQLVKNKKI